MAKYAFTEELFDTVFQYVVHIAFPRVAGGRVVEELSWSWGAMTLLTLIALAANERVSKETLGNCDKDTQETVRRMRFHCRIVLWAAVFFSLFMFRFASWF